MSLRHRKQSPAIEWKGLQYSQLPPFVKKVCGGDFAGPDGAGGRGEIDDGPVGEHGNLTGVVEIGVLAEGEAAVEDDVAGGVQWVGIDGDHRVRGGRESAIAGGDVCVGPSDGELVGEAFEHAVARGIAPENEV